MLLPRAGKIFAHVLEALQAPAATPQLALDYTTTLREVLLPVPAYCARVAEDTYARLIGIFMGRLHAEKKELANLPPPDERQRLGAVLAELLRRCPHDLPLSAWEDCLDFFEVACETAVEGLKLAAGQEAFRPLQQLLGALGVFLLRWGADVAFEAPALAAKAAPLLTAVWGTSQHVGKVREEAFAVARALMQLEALPSVPGLLHATLAAATAEVERRAAAAARSFSESRAAAAARAPPLGDALEWRALLELIADLWAHRASGAPGWEAAAPEAGAHVDEADGDAVPRKRARTLDPCARERSACACAWLAASARF